MSATLARLAMLGVLAATSAPDPGSVARIDHSDLVVEFLEDPESHALCGGVGVLSFTLAEPARVTLTAGGTALTGSVDRGARAPVQALLLPGGPHALSVELAPWIATATITAYRLEVRSERAPVQVQVLSGPLVPDVVNPAGLRIGRTFVSGIDLLDGHLVESQNDLKLPGRSLGLTATRAYTSAAAGHRGRLGVGWSLGALKGLVAREECGLYAVSVNDGFTQTFRRDAAGFHPQRGNHTTLRQSRDGSFDFEDKSANRFHFAATPDEWGVHRLEYLEETHGDRIAYRYDTSGRLLELAEVQNDGKGIRTVPRVLRVEHTAAGGFDRISRIDAPGLGLRVEYEYDIYGHLTRVTHHDEEASKPGVDTYRYSVGDARDRHRLLFASRRDGTASTYDYRSSAAPPLVFVRRPPVSKIVSQSVKHEITTTSFAYDHTQAERDKLETTVTSEGWVTRYVLNKYGNHTEVTEPTDNLGQRIWTTTWDTDHLVMIRQTNSAGYSADYEHDSRGSITCESVLEKRGAPLVIRRYQYHPRFGFLTYRDESGEISTWELHPLTGDLLRENDAKKGLTTYRQDARGRALESTAPDGSRTRYTRYDTFGYHTEAILADGTVQRFEYDSRGRRITPP